MIQGESPIGTMLAPHCELAPESAHEALCKPRANTRALQFDVNFYGIS